MRSDWRFPGLRRCRSVSWRMVHMPAAAFQRLLMRWWKQRSSDCWRCFRRLLPMTLLWDAAARSPAGRSSDCWRRGRGNKRDFAVDSRPALYGIALACGAWLARPFVPEISGVRLGSAGFLQRLLGSRGHTYSDCWVWPGGAVRLAIAGAVPLPIGVLTLSTPGGSFIYCTVVN